MGAAPQVPDGLLEQALRHLRITPEAADADERAHVGLLIGAARAYGNDGSTYQLLDVLAEPGTVQVAVAAVCDGQASDGIGVYPVMEEGAAGGAPRYAVDAEGRTLYEVQPYRMVSEGGDRMSTVDFDLARTEVAYVPLEVAGLVDEVRRLKEMGCRRGMVSMQGLGYKEILGYLDGQYDLERAVYLIKRDTRHFAKRQLTWFNRERDVIFIDKEAFGCQDEKILAYMKECMKNRNI